MSAQEAFDYMADMRNFADWDPGVRGVVQVEGSGAGPDAVYDVTVAGMRGDLVMRYRTVDFVSPREVLLVARTDRLTSVDRISVDPKDGFVDVTYDAELTLNGWMRIADPALRLMFRRIGDKAAAGMRRVLAGESVS